MQKRLEDRRKAGGGGGGGGAGDSVGSLGGGVGDRVGGRSSLATTVGVNGGGGGTTSANTTVGAPSNVWANAQVTPLGRGDNIYPHPHHHTHLIVQLLIFKSILSSPSFPLKTGCTHNALLHYANLPSKYVHRRYDNTLLI